MINAQPIVVLHRRDFMIGSGAAALAAALLGTPARADVAPPSAQFKAALDALLAGATPKDGGIDMNLPEKVENGDYVPLSLSVASPMTARDHVKAIHLFATANPRADVATFQFTPLSGRARVTSRMRLASTQAVVAVAELSDGTFLMGTRTVDVKIGGCGL